eukprot:PhM_4_TR9778/c0_g1_i1/m.39241/K00784/rnz; ribonuclease Z
MTAKNIKQWKLPPKAGGYMLHGYSRAADATGFSIPDLGIHFDAGMLVHPSRPDYVFLSHSHTDHVHMLTHMVSRRKPPMMFMPAPTVEFAERFLLSAQELTNHGYFTEEVPYETNHVSRGVKCGDVLDVKLRNQDFVVEVVDCAHSIPSVGFLFHRLKTKLKAEYQSLPGKEIAALRKSGVEVSAVIKEPLFAFLGDTTTEVFRMHPQLLSMPVVIVECSFISEDERENAKRTCHTLWPNDLDNIVKQNPETHFVLTHFSHRYKSAEILSFFQRVKEADNITNFEVWLTENDDMSPPPLF